MLTDNSFDRFGPFGGPRVQIRGIPEFKTRLGTAC